ncbi:MAG: PDZ domain-containing protein [Burkholderiaceae bacterium]
MPLHYAIRPANPGAHLFHVTVTIEHPSTEGQIFTLPAWIPGSYMIREFARHIVQIAALAGDERVPVEKLDKHTWRVPALGEGAGPLTLVYEVYAWDLSVRAAHLDTTHGFFNGSSVFLLPAGLEDEKVVVDILPPAGKEFSGWQIATGLKPARATRRHAFGTYTAANYDELIDCPVEMGEFALASFKAHGVPHEVVITGRVPNLDIKRLTSDLQRVCEVQIELFEPKSKAAPFDRYVFMTLAVGDGYGGLEHRNSTALICQRDDLPFVGMEETTEGYRQFLGLASHEYFHSWNVKRIKPAAFVPYDLSAEVNTRLLWLFEGFTSYYDDLMLLRSGLISETQYLDRLAKTLDTVQGASGRHKQSVAESSFDAWIKYYRQDENSPNAIVSYYQKGSLIALVLDLTIRAQTQGKKSLDDVMRLLWSQHQEAGADYAGVGEDDITEAVFDATGLELGQFIAELTEGTEDPDYAALLGAFGVTLTAEAQTGARQRLGIKTAANGSEARIAHVYDGGAAQAAGLSGGDVLIALDGLRVTPAKLDAMLARYRRGDTLTATAFRRDELMTFAIKLGGSEPARIKLALEAGRNKLRAGWLA